MRNKRKLLGFLVMVLGVLPCSLTIFAADTAMKNGSSTLPITQKLLKALF